LGIRHDRPRVSRVFIYPAILLFILDGCRGYCMDGAEMKPDGYRRLPTRYKKLYVAVVKDDDLIKKRILNRIFKRATDANIYCLRVVDRWNRLNFGKKWFDNMITKPFKQRLRLAWRIVRGR
jgi:hypothetical protein